MPAMKRSSTRPSIKNLKTRRERKREGGQILVLFVLAIVVIMGFTALVIDVGLVRNANQNLWNALDAGTLAGARDLPGDPDLASANALEYAEANFPGGLPPGVTVGFRCIIGSVAGNPRMSDVPGVCNPGPGATWMCNAKICAAVCVPGPTTSCNAIVLEGTATVGYRFGNAVGVSSGSTKNVLSAACKGPCGVKSSDPVDLVLIVDRTPSMEAIDVTNARSASHSLRSTYSPDDQWISFGMIGPSLSGTCLTDPDPVLGNKDLRRWVPVPLSGIGAPINEDYKSSSSTLARSMTCFTRSSNTVATDLEDPIRAAAAELALNGRPDVTKGIILMSDGQPNNSVDGGRFSTTYNYCEQANIEATAAKNAGIIIFTVGFGLDGPDNINCLDTSGPFRGRKATALLASMAVDSLDDHGCPGTENDDDDHYFCVPKTDGASADLSKIFKKAANALVGGTKLIQLP